MKTLALIAASLFLFASSARAEMDEHAAKAVQSLKDAQEALKQSPVMGHAHGDFKKADIQIKAAIKNIEGGVKLYDRDLAKKNKKGKGSMAKGGAATPPPATTTAPDNGSGSAGAPPAAAPPADAPPAAAPPAGADSGT